MDNVPTMVTKNATFFCNNDDATTGVDYLEVKTAVANRAVKKYGEMNYVKTDNIVDFDKIKMGSAILLREPAANVKITRIIGLPTDEEITGIAGLRTFTFTPQDAVIEAGDIVKFYYNDMKSVTGTVDTVTVDGEVTVTLDADAVGATKFDSYEITSVGKESCDASAKIVTLNVNPNRHDVLKTVEFTKASDVTWTSASPTKLTATFEKEDDAIDFMDSINGEDSVVATFGTNKEEYIGVNVSGPKAVESETPKTSAGTFKVVSVDANTRTATGTVTFGETDVPDDATYTCDTGTISKSGNTWTFVYTEEATVPEVDNKISFTATYPVLEYVVTMELKETK